MYDELIQILRYCDNSHYCKNCPAYDSDKCTSLLSNTATALEKLQKIVKAQDEELYEKGLL